MEETVKFGIKQIKNPTPMWATGIHRTASAITLVWAIIQHLPMGLDKPVIDNINQWVLVLLPVIHAITKSFGINLENHS